MDHTRQASTLRPARRAALTLGLALMLIGGGVALARIDFRTHRVERDKLTIETVRQGTMEIKVSASGQLLPRNVEQIAAQSQGRVARKYVQPGDRVIEGAPILELTNPQLLASAQEAYSAWEGAVTELRAAQSELQTNLMNQQVVLTQARFSLEKAQVQLEAESRLAGQHIIPEIDYKRSQLNVAQLTRTREIEASRLQKFGENIEVQLAVRQAHVTQLERALDRARTDAAGLKVVAGMAGIVQAISVDIGQELQPGSPIGRIAQPQPLYAELKVPAREAIEVQTGQPAVIDTHAALAEGVVTRVDPAVTDGIVIVDVELHGTSLSGARPQTAVEGTVFLNRISDTLFVGRPSYVKTNAAITVYKLDADGHYASRVAITAGRLSVNYLQVLRGLRAGDRIITSDSGEWQDQSRILIN